ncbi:MAG TPA: YiiD C-terminal domain-containing protein [Acidiferrobacterales bacterium]|jgi:thioesterase domain-containing protein
MDLRELERYLHEQIPLSAAMGVEVLAADRTGVRLSAPLAPNINHRETVFGGSASAVAILAAWALIHVRLTEEGIASRVVIQRNTMRYERPIVAAFVASSAIQDPRTWEQFIKVLKRKHRARISVTATLHCGGENVGELEGDFVALDARPA